MEDIGTIQARTHHLIHETLLLVGLLPLLLLQTFPDDFLPHASNTQATGKRRKHAQRRNEMNGMKAPHDKRVDRAVAYIFLFLDALFDGRLLLAQSSEVGLVLHFGLPARLERVKDILGRGPAHSNRYDSLDTSRKRICDDV